MNYVVWDLETDSADTNWLTILEIGAILLDENFKEIVNDGYNGKELALRNNPKIRKLFAEIMCILCLANKKHPFSSALTFYDFQDWHYSIQS